MYHLDAVRHGPRRGYSQLSDTTLDLAEERRKLRWRARHHFLFAASFWQHDSTAECVDVLSSGVRVPTARRWGTDTR